MRLLESLRLTKPATLPWLAAGLLPDAMTLLETQPGLMAELGDLSGARPGRFWADMELTGWLERRCKGHGKAAADAGI